MAVLKKADSYALAEAVVSVMEVMVDAEFPDDLHVLGAGNGLHIQNWCSDRRCTIVGLPGKDRLLLWIGGVADFDRGNLAHDSASVCEFAAGEITQTAVAALDWLQQGLRPKNAMKQ